MTRIAQLTDVHARPPGGLAYGRVDTNAHLDAAIDHLNAFHDAQGLDGVVVTGDVVDLGQLAEYATARAALDRLHAPWWPIPGNHDGDAFWDVFADRMPGAVRGVGYVAACGDLALTLLDTRVPGASHGAVTDARAVWLAGALSDAAAPALLALHHPPIRTGIGHMDAIGLRGLDLLAEALSARPPAAILAGHVHRTIIGAFAGVPVLVGPSPAHAVILDLAPDAPSAFATEPPGVLVHCWTDEGLTTHLSHVGTFDGPFPFASSEG